MKVTGRALPSTHDNVNDVVGGRKTLHSIGGGSKEQHEEAGVLVNVVGADDAVIFSDEVVTDESYPSLDDTSDDDDDETEEESEEESEEEEEYDEGKFLRVVGFDCSVCDWMFLNVLDCTSTLDSCQLY